MGFPILIIWEIPLLFLLHLSMKVLKGNRIAPDGTPRFAASHLGLFCLSMSHKKYTMLIWTKQTRWKPTHHGPNRTSIRRGYHLAWFALHLTMDWGVSGYQTKIASLKNSYWIIKRDFLPISYISEKDNRTFIRLFSCTILETNKNITKNETSHIIFEHRYTNRMF